MSKIEFKLADQLSIATQLIAEAHNIRRNTSYARRNDGIAWEVWATGIGGIKRRIFSFDSMLRCVSKGFDIANCGEDLEAIAKE